MKKLSVFTVAAFACLCLIGVMSSEVLANGTETLGIPGTGDVDPTSDSFTPMDIASGSGIVVAGKGFAVADQPVDITFDVPDDSTVKQVLLYWEGSNDSADVCNSDVITVNEEEITGELIGGPYSGSQNWNGLGFRADITNEGMVGPGDNTLTVDNVNFGLVANGVGVLVIYEKTSLGEAEISILDGHDFAYYDKIDPTLQSTVPQTFTFSEASVDRTANFKMFFSSVSGTHSSGDPDEFRPTAIKIDIKHKSDAILTTYWHDNKLDSHNGEEWDTVILDNIIIPPGATTLTVQAFSGNRLGLRDSEDDLLNPASLTWITAALSVSSPPSEECGPCEGKITELTLQYTEVESGANITVFQKKVSDPIFDKWVEAGGQFTFIGTDKKGTMGTEISIFVNESKEAKLHTSCSQDIYTGLEFGGNDGKMFEIISGESRNGGPLCPLD